MSTTNFYRIKIFIVTSLILLATFHKSAAQCTSAQAGMTYNGIAITGSGNSYFAGPEKTSCGFTTPANSLNLDPLNTSNGGIDYTFYFSKKVNNLRFILTGDFGRFDYFGVDFTSSYGPVFITPTQPPCRVAVSDVFPSVITTRVSMSTGGDGPGGGEFIVSVEGGFDALKISAKGGTFPNRIALCAESLIACPDVPVFSAITQPSCASPAGSFTISNYNAANTYTVSPAESASISSTGVVTATEGNSYTVTAANATCTSSASQPVVMNNLLCPVPDVYTVQVNQLLTANLRSNDGYIPPGTVYYIPVADPEFTNPSDCVPLVVNEVNGDATLTFTCAIQGTYHFRFPVAIQRPIGRTLIRVPLTITVTAPLPVTLTSFTANREAQAINLNWATTRETNSDRFEIEYGTDGKLWSRIGTVAAAGESELLNRYSFLHAQPQQGQNLYRLKMIDKDLTFSYSRIQSVNFEGLEANAVYPNPVLDGKIQLRDWTNIKAVELYNQQGDKVKVFLPADQDKMDVSRLEAGLYVIRILRINGTTESQKIVVNK